MKRNTSVLSRVRVDNERKSATRGSRADEGVRPTLAQSRIVKNSAGQDTSPSSSREGQSRRFLTVLIREVLLVATRAFCKVDVV